MADPLRSTLTVPRLTAPHVGLYAAGCAARLAPVAAAIAWPLARKVFTACTDAAWTGGGRLDPALAAHLERGVRRVLIAESVDEFGAEVADLLAAAGHAVAACRTGDPEEAEQAARRAVQVYESLDEAVPAGNWAARERTLQEHSARLLARTADGDAAALVRAVTHDGAGLVAAMAAAGWCAPPPAAGMPSEAAWSTAPPSPFAGTPTAATHPARVIVAAAATECPTGPDGTPTPPYRPGDVLRVACDIRVTEVTKVSAYDAFVRWPWPRPRHPGSSQAFARDPERDLWTPFTLDPPPGSLTAGDPCRVGIPPTTVYALQVWTSRRGEHLLTTLPTGRTAIGGWAEEAGAIEPYDDPIELALVHRAYAFLEPGDTVVDAAGRELVFAPPVLFVAADGRLVAPEWPLSLPAYPRKVLNQTAEGDHGAVLAAWERAAGARLPHPDFLRSWFTLPDLRAWPFGRA